MATTCLITAGINAAICRNSIPGVSTLYIANFDQVTSFDELNGTITGITMSGSSVFYEYKVNQNSTSMTQTPTVSVENSVAYWSTEISATFGTMDASKRNLLKTLAIGNFVIIVKDNNAKYWFVGSEKGAYLSGGSVQTGTAGTDLSGAQMVFTSTDLYPACEVDASIIAGLLT